MIAASPAYLADALRDEYVSWATVDAATGRARAPQVLAAGIALRRGLRARLRPGDAGASPEDIALRRTMLAPWQALETLDPSRAHFSSSTRSHELSQPRCRKDCCRAPCTRRRSARRPGAGGRRGRWSGRRRAAFRRGPSGG